MQSKAERKYHFSAEQKEALWRAGEEKCFYCRQSLKITEATIDHVVPEHFLYHQEEFEKFKTECPIDTIFPSFKINGYDNWVSSHGQSCNYRKGEQPFPPQVTIWYLTLVARNLPKVEQELEKLKSGKGASKVLARLETLIEKKHISEMEAMDSASKSLSEVDMLKVVNVLAYSRHIDEPLVITFGLSIDDVIQMRDISDEIVAQIWQLYDCLERELVNHLKSLSNYPFYYTEESLRNGESLSVRLVFSDLTLKNLEKLNLSNFNLPCWEILELTHFHAVYRTQYSQEIDSELKILQGYLQPSG
jgi:hypothetical protein